DYSPDYRAQMSGVVAIVGRLVETSVALTQLRFEPSEADRRQLRKLAAAIASIRTSLVNRRVPGSILFKPDAEHSPSVPFLGAMENIVSLIPQAYAGSRSTDEYWPASEEMPRQKL